LSDANEGQALLRKAESGDAASQFSIGLAYAEGKYGGKTNAEAALTWFRKAAEAGYAHAQLQLAKRLYNSLYRHSEEDVRHVDSDSPEGKAVKTEALQWFRKAAQQGVPEAEFELADALENEGSVAGDEAASVRIHSEALEMYRKAADQGHSEAQYRMAKILCEGPFDPPATRQKGEAVKWYRKAAEQGHTGAWLDLAVLLDLAARGLVALEDPTNWTEKVSRRDLPNSFECSFMGIPTNQVIDRTLESESWDWCRRAAETNYNEWATIRFASHCESIGDYDQAARWWRVVAARSPFAASKLADLYDQGRGVQLDQLKATSVLLSVATNTDYMVKDRLKAYPQPLLSLAQKYETGSGLPQDTLEAYKWFDLLGAGYCWFGIWDTNVSAAARQRRDSMAKGMSASKISQARERVTLYLHCKVEPYFVGLLELAERGDAHAQLKMALIYEIGDMVCPTPNLVDSKYLPNPIAAERWYERAASCGDAEVQYELGQHYLSERRNTEAMRCLHKAAEQGHNPSQCLLGNCYTSGQAVRVDFVQAYKWYLIALAGAESASERSPSRDDLQSVIASLGQRMAPQQIVFAEQFAKEFVSKKHGAASNAERDGVDPKSPKASGSGFFIAESGYLISNFHVVEGAARIKVMTKRGTFPAKVIRADSANDLAILRVSGSDFAALPVAASKDTKLGHAVFTVGFPNPSLQGIEPKFTDGKISSLSGPLDDARYFQISVAVQPGNSGGPLVNSAGNVIGVVTARLSDTAGLETSGALPQNVNYAVKSAYILSLIEALPELAGKLSVPLPAKGRSFEDVVKDAEAATVMVLAY
jgi:TPR repeat protein